MLILKHLRIFLRVNAFDFTLSPIENLEGNRLTSPPFTKFSIFFTRINFTRQAHNSKNYSSLHSSSFVLLSEKCSKHNYTSRIIEERILAEPADSLIMKKLIILRPGSRNELYTPITCISRRRVSALIAAPFDRNESPLWRSCDRGTRQDFRSTW